MKNLKSLLLLLLVVFAITKTNAQVGIGTTNPFAALDVFSGTDGLLIPRVVLTATTVVLPVLTGTESELVYNTNTLNDVTPGFYFLSSATGPWVRLGSGATNSWLITGNSNIVDGTNFLGTTNNVDVAFRRNGTAAGKIGTTNTSFGLNTYNSFLSSNITCFGANAGSALTGQDNTAIGANAMDGLSAGASRENTAVGFNALSANTGATVSNCTAIGFQAGQNITSIDNTAVGWKALLGSAGSEKSTAVGAGSMEQQSAGYNTALGFRALFNGTATGNVAVGNQAGEFHGAGALCTMIGFQASAPDFTNSAAFGNGAVAGASNNMKFGNASIVANHFSGKIGLAAAGVVPNGSLDLNVTNDGIVPPKAALTSTGTVAPVVTGIEGELIYNTNSAGDVTPGYYYLTAAGGPWSRLGGGGWALLGNTGTNPANNFIGTTDAQDLRFRRQNQWAGTIASNVTSFGSLAGRDNTSTNNTFIGNSAGMNSSNLSSSNIVAIGTQAMGAAGAQNVSQSVAIGSFAMQSPTNTATNNVVIGYQAGISLSTSNNVIIGQGASSGFAGSVVIGQGAAAAQAGHIRIAGVGTVLATTPASWTVVSDRRAKSNIKDSALGLDFIKTLRPVSYFKKIDENKKTEYGFIAQEVEASLKKVGDNNNGVIYIDPDGNYGMRYNDIIPITVKAVQEQQELIEQLKKANAELVKANATILKRLEKLEKSKSD